MSTLVASGLLDKPVVLIVEDEELVGKMLTFALQRQGYRVLLASSGERAVECFRADQNIALILLDVRMGGMDGPQTLAALQAIDPYVACCFVTGDTGKYSEEDLLARGALRVIKKPFRLHEIAEVVEQLSLSRTQQTGA